MFRINRDLSKNLTKLEISQILTKIAKILSKTEIFKNFHQSRYFERLRKNRDFERFWPKSLFLEYVDENPDFSKVRHKLRFFLANFDQNRTFLWIFTKIETFKDFDQYCFFLKFWLQPDFSNVSHILRFFENLTKIEMLRKFWPKLRFSKILIKIEIFRKSSPKLRFSKILTKIAIFSKFRPKSRFSGIWTKIKIFRIKSRFIGDFHLTWVCYQFWPKSIVFEKKIPKLRFSTILKKNQSTPKIFTKIKPFTDFDQNRYFS